MRYALSEVFAKGGEGGKELAQTICDVIDETEGKSHFAPIYPDEAPVEEKIETIAKTIYGADKVTYTSKALKSLKEIKPWAATRCPCASPRPSTPSPTTRPSWAGPPALPSPSVT